jgi:hypothetical protein
MTSVIVIWSDIDNSSFHPSESYVIPRNLITLVLDLHPPCEMEAGVYSAM